MRRSQEDNPSMAGATLQVQAAVLSASLRPDTSALNRPDSL
jgi:hypothetical protein